MKKTRVKLPFIVDLICFIGCSIQIYHITCIYLKFKVRSEVTYDYTHQVELPTIDIIIPMALSINLNELFIRYPEQMTYICVSIYAKKNNYTIDNFNSECSYGIYKVAFLASYSIAQFIKVKDIKELTIDPRKQIDYIQVGNSNLMIDKCNLTRYYNGLAIFLRISCTEQAALFTNTINIIGSYKGNIAAIGHSFGSYFGIRFSSQLDMPVSELSKYFMVNQRSGKQVALVWVRYEKRILRSLPYPYETNCRFYNKFMVLKNCIFNYTFNEGFLLRSIVNEWDSQQEHLDFAKPPSFDYDYSNIYEYEYEYDFRYKEVNKVQLMLATSHCVQQTLVPECELTTYLTDGEIASEQVDYSSGSIFIEQPMTPIMYFNVHPHLLLSEYLIFVGSIIGTWFGYSIFDRLISILTWIRSKFMEKLRKSRESKRPTKIFIARNPYFSDPLCPSTSHSSIDNINYR